MKRTVLLTFAATALLASCQKKENPKHEKIKKAAWLVGTWENESPQGKLAETWNKTNDSTFNGHSYFVKGSDTLHLESITLSQRGDVMTYTPTVQGQNNNKPVEFRMTSATDKQMVFENPNHDFPKKIIYNQINPDSLVAEISGVQQGKASMEKYPMKKK